MFLYLIQVRLGLVRAKERPAVGSNKKYQMLNKRNKHVMWCYPPDPKKVPLPIIPPSYDILLFTDTQKKQVLLRF